MEKTPKYYRFSRVTIGNMIAIGKVFSRLAVTTIGSSALSGFAQLAGGSHLDLLIPLVMSVIAFWSAIISEQLTWIVSVSEITDPI